MAVKTSAIFYRTLHLKVVGLRAATKEGGGGGGGRGKGVRICELQGIGSRIYCFSISHFLSSHYQYLEE